MRVILFALLIFSSFFVQSQSILVASVECSDTFYTIKTNEARITLNFRTGALQLTADLSTFNSDNKVVNQLKDSVGGKIIYNANINIDEFKFIQEENMESLIPIQGTLSLNNKEKGVIGSYKLFKLNNNREEEEKNIRITLLFDADPSDHNINGVLPELSNPIRFELIEAVILRLD